MLAYLLIINMITIFLEINMYCMYTDGLISIIIIYLKNVRHSISNTVLKVQSQS